jgi:signal transduction histidine kinase
LSSWAWAWAAAFAAAETLGAVRLSFGYLSLASPLAWLAAGQLGLAPALAFTWLTLLVRSRGRWRELLSDGLPASLAAGAHYSLGGVASLPLLFLAGWPLTVILRNQLSTEQQDDLAPLAPQLAGMLALGPLAGALLPSPAALLLLPVLLGLRSSAGQARQLGHYRQQRVDARVQARNLHSTAEYQEQQQRTLQAQARALELLRLVHAEDPRPQIAALLQQQFPELACGFGAAPPGATASGGIWVRQGAPLSLEQQITLDTFMRYASLMLESSERLQRETQARQRLQWLLESAPRLSSEDLRSVGAEVATRLAGTAAIWSNSPAGPMSFAVRDNLHLCFAHLPADPQALRLWAWLLSASWNRNEAQSALTQASKLAAVGQLAAGLAHELNTPLGALTLALSVARQSLESRPDRALSRLEQATQAVTHMQGVVDKLLSYARNSGQTRREVDLAGLIRDSVSLLHPFQPALHLQPVTLEIDPGEIQQVLLNLFVNARQAGDTVHVSLQCDEHWAWVDVADSGPGVDVAIRDRIFDPFFTTREVGHGTGLGLSISRQIAAAHGGTLELLESDGGARFRLRLPR